MLAFMTGELSRADGVGIIFSGGLPRSSDIQKIISVCLAQLHLLFFTLFHQGF